MTLRAILLDFDGVILESNRVKTEVFREIFSRFPEHLGAMMQFHEQNAWASRYLKLDHLVFDRLGRPSDVALRDELAAEFGRLTLERLTVTPFVVGAKEFLAEFSARIPLAVISVTPQTDLETVVIRRDIGGFFSGVYGCPPWTKVSASRDFLENCHISPADTVLIGDAPGDERAAGEIGCEFVCRQSDIPFPSASVPCFDDMTGVASILRPRLERGLDS